MMLEFKSVEFQQDLTLFSFRGRQSVEDTATTSYRLIGKIYAHLARMIVERAGFSARHEHDPKFSILAISKWPISKKTVLPLVRLAIAHAVRVIEIGRV
jgi:hypothetical protein